MRKDLKEYLRQLEKDGWRVIHGGKHIKVYSPNPNVGMVTVATTSGVHAISAVKRDVRREELKAGIQ